MGLKPKDKGHTNFYECCDLTKKIYLVIPVTHFKNTNIYSISIDTYLYLYCMEHNSIF